MAEPAPLSVIYSPAALNELEENWDWNVEHNGIDQARAYRRFLTDEINALSVKYDDGRRVSTRPDLRFVTMFWSTGGHGHVAVYKVDHGTGTVIVAHVFHTRQNWEEKMKREKRRHG